MADVKISDLTDGSPIQSGDMVEIERPGSPNTSRRVALGTMAGEESADYLPATGGTVDGNLTVNPTAADVSAFLTIVSEGAASSNLFLTNYRDAASEPIVVQQHARGTEASPAALNNNDRMGRFDWRGHDGSSGFVTGIRIQGNVAQASPGPTQMGSRLIIQIVPEGSVSLSEILRLDHTGGLQMFGANAVINAARHPVLRSYTVATLPDATQAGQLIYVADGASNKRLAVSDGSAWRFPDGSTVS